MSSTRMNGRPRARELVRDALVGARTHPATTLTLALTVAVVCVLVLLTTGQSAAAERAVVAQIDSAGTRMIVVSDSAGAARIHADAASDLERLSDVTLAFGLGEAVDVRNSAIEDQRASSRKYVGTLPADIALASGRMPRPGEAIAGEAAASTLRLAGAMGSVRAIDDPTLIHGVVGTFTARGPLSHLNDLVLIHTSTEEIDSLRYLYVLASDVSTIDRLRSVLSTSVSADSPDKLSVETPAGAVALRDVISGQLGESSRQLMALALGIGSLIIAVTLLGSTANRRRDFGRNRALGQSRSALIASLLVQTAAGSLLGIVFGMAIGLSILALIGSGVPTFEFVAGVAGLTFLTSLIAATPIAIHAAYRDPVRILRVP